MSDSFFFGVPDGVISAPGEIDPFPVELVGGFSYAAFASGVSTGGGTLWDPAVLLFDANGSLLAHQDDSGYPELGWDPLFEFVAPYSGVYYVGVTDLYGGTGSYGVQHVDTTYHGI